MLTKSLLTFLLAFADYQVEIDNYNDYEPKYAVVDHEHKELRLTDDYRELWVALDEGLPVYDIEKNIALKFGVYYHYGDTGEDELMEVYDTMAEAEAHARNSDKHVDSENYELGDYYFAKEIQQ
jgi:hypothetical protein